MCAYNDPIALQKLRNRTKPIRAWKVVKPCGLPIFRWRRCAASYGPGRAAAKGVTRAAVYDRHNPRGLHAYRTKRAGTRMASFPEIVVPVYIDPKDLIAAEPAGEPDAQVVACRLTIRPEDWEAAGLPARVTRRRYV